MKLSLKQVKELNVNSPSQSELLFYNNSSSKWENRIAEISDINKLTESGSPSRILYNGNILAYLSELSNGELSWSFSAARNGTYNIDADLRRQNGTPTNLAPYIIPINATIVAISASCNGTETWDAEVYINNTEVGQVSVVASDKAYAIVSINVNAGDEVRFRFNMGSSGAVDRPAMSAFFIAR